MLAWSLVAGAAGVYPDRRHDGSPFESGEESHQVKAGTPMAAKLAVIELRGDWPALTDEFGLRQWQHGQHPCFLCRCPLSSMNDVSGYTATSGPWPLWTQHDHAAYISQHKKVGWGAFGATGEVGWSTVSKYVFCVPA